MTLFRQLFIGSSLVFFVLLLGIEFVYLTNARLYLQQQLASDAQNAATSLAISLGTKGTLDDPGLVQAIISPVFDRGYFESIRVVSTNGQTVAGKTLATASGDAPAWFVRLFPLRAPGSEALVNAGWKQLGRVAVTSHAHFIYQQLWHTAIETLTWLGIAFIAALIGLRTFLAGILRPLRSIEEAALSTARREFGAIRRVGGAREFDRVAAAMNLMSSAISRAISEESERADCMRKKAYEDSVTGLLTRRGFEHEFAATVLDGHEVFSGVLALLQLDRFKQFNDQQGHARGDELLSCVARAIVKSREGRTTIATRLTGADFAILTANLDAGEARQWLAQLTSQIRASLADQFAGERLAFYCGAAHFDAGSPSLSALLATADLALARAREHENSKVELAFVARQQPAERGSQEWRCAIEGALARNELLLYEQPVIALSDRRVLHSEVLVRLSGENGRIVPATDFIPMVARHGLFPPLDVAMCRKLFAHFAGQPAPAHAIALNISGQTVADAHSVTLILDFLRDNRALAAQLIFEMTEFGCMRNATRTLDFARSVRALGAQFAMDNFVMHRAGLAVLPALLPAYLKIAAELMHDMTGEGDASFLVTSLSRMAQPLGIALIAQGVEQEAIVNRLQELGFSGYQGFISGTPAPLL